jgi:hypothetical protein
MNFLKLSTMQYPYQEGDIRLEHPEITDDQTGATFPVFADYVEVEQTTQPNYNPKTQYLSQSTPVQINGVWQSVWVVNDFTPEELTAIAERDKPIGGRNQPPLTNSGTAPNVIA